MAIFSRRQRSARELAVLLFCCRETIVAKRIPPLTEIACRRKFYDPAGGNKLFDGEGLYLELRPSGAKLWRPKYRFAGKERLLSIGSYPEVSSEQARAARAEAKTLLVKGVDPSIHRRSEKLTRELSTATTFRAVAEEWIERFSPGWRESHTRTIEVRLKNDVYAWLGERPIADLTAPELLAVLRRVEKRGALETAHRIRQYFGLIFRYAIYAALGLVERRKEEVEVADLI